MTRLIDPGTVLAFTEFAKDRNHNIVRLHFGKYLEFSCAAIERLQEKVYTSDYVSVELLARTLRATSIQVGAHELSLMFRKIEEDAKQKCLDQFDENALAQLISLHSAVNQALTTIASDPVNWLQDTR